MSKNKTSVKKVDHLRKMAEKKIFSDSAVPGFLTSEFDTMHLMSQLQLHQIELGVQNEEMQRTISDLKRTKLALIESEKRYRAVIEDQTETIARYQPDGTVTFVNEVYCRLFGKSSADLVGKGWQPVVYPEDIPVVIAELNKMSVGNPVVVIENRVYTATGELRWMQFVNRGFFDDHGRLIETQAVGRDISERKALEETLKEREQNVLTILEGQVLERTISLTQSNQRLHDEIVERKQVEEQLRNHQQKLQSMSNSLSMIEARERDRIAEELHDQVGQRLILGKIKLDSLASLLPPNQFNNEVEVLNDLLEQSVQDIRSLIFQLRPPILASVGLEAAVQWLGEELKEEYGLQIEFSDDNNPKPLKYEVRSAVFQVIRELLINVRKHAGTKHVKIMIKRETGQMVANIEDNGIGFDRSIVLHKSSKECGFGLFSVEQKIDYLGGELVIDTAPGQGTRVTIKVPLDESGDQHW